MKTTIGNLVVKGLKKNVFNSATVSKYTTLRNTESSSTFLSYDVSQTALSNKPRDPPMRHDPLYPKKTENRVP